MGFSGTETLSKSVVAATEWQSARLSCLVPKRNISATLPLIEERHPTLSRLEVSVTTIPLSEAIFVNLPHIEEVSCFTDAAWITSSGSCGMGWIFKTHDQRVIHQGSSSRLHTPSALAVEALAMKLTLTAALLMDLTSITVSPTPKS